ncbi:MAG: hypothetical protein ACRETR_11400, partial [Steroidobacteraceae bacterium]
DRASRPLQRRERGLIPVGGPSLAFAAALLIPLTTGFIPEFHAVACRVDSRRGGHAVLAAPVLLPMGPGE